MEQTTKKLHRVLARASVPEAVLPGARHEQAQLPPGVIAAGSVSDEPLAFWDFLPTACELAGVEAPQGIDGISFVPTLKGEEQKSHEYLFWKYQKKLAIRKEAFPETQSSTAARFR